jgi:hypothetical protein
MAINILGQVNCGGTTSTFNSGLPLCDVVRKQPKGLLLIDSGVEFTPAQATSKAVLIAAIKTATRAARGSRVYPIFDLTDFQDKTKEPTKATVGPLSTAEVVVTDAIPAFDAAHYKGDLFHQQLVAAQNSNLKVIIIDSAYNMYATTLPSGNITGFSLNEFYAALPKFATASETAKYPFSLALASLTEIKENLSITALDSSVLGITGNRDITLAKVSQAANIINISVTGRGGKNIGDLYAVELAVGAAWSIKNTQTGAVVTVTNVTYDTVNGYYVVTADSVAYAALTTTQKFDVNLVSAAALSALAVDGYESTGIVQIVKP